ncbi:unnamed protein product, partial [Mesorhabditis belari]|uniref:Uncharacterized protein n=1 Tax=Mesorhabditis belari TaxID=2138241 RepID=A0AAF3F166_9BILA
MTTQRQSSLLKFFAAPGQKLAEENAVETRPHAVNPPTPKARSKKLEILISKDAFSLKREQRKVDETKE